MDRNSEVDFDPSATTHRSPSTTDFSSLFKQALRTSGARKTVSFADPLQSENHDSEESQLYMACPKPSERTRKSLSSIGNRSSRDMDGNSDDRIELEVEENINEATDPAEELAWMIIDQEIYEWQYLCRTGRPYWQCPESKYNRLTTVPDLSQNLGGQPGKRWMPMISGSKARPNYKDRRQAFTETYLADPASNTHMMAHMIAIQLVSACFTLPLNSQTSGHPPPNYTMSPVISDHRMISSLRMHTQYRYSPRFGHEQRNSSPACPSRRSQAGSMVQHTAASGKRRRRVQKSHAAEDPTTSLDGGAEEPRDSQEWETEDEESTARQLGDHEFRQNHLPFFAGKPKEEQNPTAVPPRRRKRSRSIRGSSFDQRTNYRLHPVIRSEPHPIYVQPVKEMVVKRWRSFRRRFGGSLHAPLPYRKSDDGSAASSPALSTDAEIRRTRRRRAQKESEIYSEAGPEADPSPGLHMSTTGDATTNSIPPLTDAVVAAGVLAHDERRVTPETPTTTAPFYSFTSPGTNVPSPLSLTNVYTPSNSEQRSQSRRQRKSGLLEMHTPESFAEEVDEEGTSQIGTRGILSPAGSALSPEERHHSTLFSGDSSYSTRLASVISTTESFIGPLARSPRRPRLTRTSTSGTQVFCLGEDGVEVNGVPGGPKEDFWNRPDGKRRERTYL